MNILVTLRKTKKFFCYTIKTLKECGLSVLELPSSQYSIELKSYHTLFYTQAWRDKIINIISDEYSNALECPCEPIRPDYNSYTADNNDSCTIIENNVYNYSELLSYTRFYNNTNSKHPFDDKAIKSMIKRNSIECTIHAIANAESYAIELFWDLIVRYIKVRNNYTIDNTCKDLNDSDHNNDNNKETNRILELPMEFYHDMMFIVEQEAQHFLSWYDRLHELNCPFGIFPFSQGLWQSAYVTRHNITARLAIINMIHEAKGLDTYEKTKEKFINCIDNISLSILEHNYKEEIIHVSKGLKWFKYCYFIDFPEHTLNDTISYFHRLAKHYFKGKLKEPFNHTARFQAGMHKEWYLPLT